MNDQNDDQQRWICQSGQADEPIKWSMRCHSRSVCTRSVRYRLFKPHADYEHCAAKQLDFYGFKLGLLITRLEMSNHYVLLAAQPYDGQLVDNLLVSFEGALADKGCIDAFHQLELARQHAIELITLPAAT